MTKKQAKEKEEEKKEERGVYSPLGHDESESIRDGSIDISTQVIAALASQAAHKVEGVHVVGSGGISGFFSGRESHGVNVSVDDESGHVDINVDINVDYGINIYDASHKLQRTIKEEVEALTGSMNVDKINIRVKHLVMPDDKTDESDDEEVVSPDNAYATDDTQE
jgi:uncharacterized alkaline shock family protein YloU